MQEIVAEQNHNLTTFDGIPTLEIKSYTQLVTVPDRSPTISVLWDRAVQQAVIDTAVGPTIASRAYALMHTAIFDAWAAYDPKAIATQLGDDLQRPKFEITEANKQEAMSFAAYRVLSELFPYQIPIFNDLMSRLGFNPSNSTTDTTTAAGIGNVSARTLMEFRREDGSNQTGNALNGTLGVPYADISGYEPVNPPGNPFDIERWTPELINIDTELGAETIIQNCLTPHWGNITPFALESGSQFRPEAPEPFLLVEGKVDLEKRTITLEETNEVLPITKDLIGTIINPEFIAQTEKIIEVSANLTDEQKLIAEFWEDGAGTSFPPGTWMTFGEFVSARDDHSVDEDAQLFFALGNAVFDAGIASWEAKISYDYVRPFRAVRELGELGLIGEFDADLGGYAIEAWSEPGKGTQTILATDFITYQTPGSDPSPPFAEYTSGHSAFSAAGAEILQRFTGNDNFGGSVTFEPGKSRFEPGLTPQNTVTLGWDTFTEAADEAGISRIYGGIHFDDGDLNGRQLGREVGQTVWEQAQFFIQGGEQPPEQEEFILGTTGDDRFNAVNYRDNFRGNGDLLFAEAGNDIIDASLATEGGNRIFAGAGNDLVFAGIKDIVCGDDGNDLLNSLSGQGNILLGGDGDDIFWAGNRDYLTGGNGKDTFWIANDELPREVNTIQDFNLAEDKIGIAGTEGITSVDDLSFSQIGTDMKIDFNGQDIAILSGIDASLQSEHFIFTELPF